MKKSLKFIGALALGALVLTGCPKDGKTKTKTKTKTEAKTDDKTKTEKTKTE